MKKILQQNRPLIGTGIFSSDQFIAKKYFNVNLIGCGYVWSIRRTHWKQLHLLLLMQD